MRKGLPCPAVILASLISMPSLSAPLAQGQTYAGGQFAFLIYDEDGVPDDGRPRAVIGRLGYFVAERVAVEARLGAGVRDDTVQVPIGPGGTVGIDLELDRLIGGYLLGHIPLGQSVSVYGLAGYTEAEVTASVDGLSSSETEGGISYGIGAEFHPTDQTGVNVEYIRYLDKSDFTLSGVSIGATFHF